MVDRLRLSTQMAAIEILRINKRKCETIEIGSGLWNWINEIIHNLVKISMTESFLFCLDGVHFLGVTRKFDWQPHVRFAANFGFFIQLWGERNDLESIWKCFSPSNLNVFCYFSESTIERLACESFLTLFRLWSVQWHQTTISVNINRNQK